MEKENDNQAEPLTKKEVWKTWLPLVVSWLLMSLELPSINAIVARLPNAEINLAAYGGVVFPIALTIEAPVIMLLAASTALSRDWQSYQKLKKIMWWMAGVLGTVHLLVAATPLYDFIVNVLLQAPEVVVEPGRLGLLFITPWTVAIAYRRFQQGTMIRFGHSKIVARTAMVRLATLAAILTIGITTRSIPGTILAGLAQGLGVTVEAIYTGWLMRRIIPEIKDAQPVNKPLTLKRFSSFYLPLAITSSLSLLWLPMISGAISRMPNPLESLAIWSVVTGLLFMFRTPGLAYNEAVVALMEEPGAFRVIRRFTLVAGLAAAGIAILIVLLPISQLWFSVVANLNPSQVITARMTLALGIPLTLFSIYISYFQGIIVYLEKTGPVAEAVVVFIIILGIILVAGVVTDLFQGVYVATAAFSTAHLAQALWLKLRSRKNRQEMAAEGL
jgi:hypothetical protein